MKNFIKILFIQLYLLISISNGYSQNGHCLKVYKFNGKPPRSHTYRMYMKFHFTLYSDSTLVLKYSESKSKFKKCNEILCYGNWSSVNNKFYKFSYNDTINSHIIDIYLHKKGRKLIYIPKLFYDNQRVVESSNGLMSFKEKKCKKGTIKRQTTD